MATQMITKALMLQALNIFMPATGAFGGGGLPGFGGGLDLGGGAMALSNPRMFSFATGGIPPVNRPSIVGEQGPELFVPRTSGTIIPAGPTAGIRGMMASGTPILNMSFETTRFGDTDYVSRDQLEAAMAQTRRQAANDGARRGMTMTLDKLQQSPSTRSRVGIG
jgi:hypothetical protein